MADAMISTAAAQADQLTLAELLSALSHALDITEGQPDGPLRALLLDRHAHRMRARARRPASCRELYYTLLLKESAARSNAARICELYLADDLAFKRDFKQIDRRCRRCCGSSSPYRLHAGLAGACAASSTSCATAARSPRTDRNPLHARRRDRPPDALFRASPTASSISTSTGTAAAGRWACAATAIPLFARIALLAQVVDVFHDRGGREAAIDEVRGGAAAGSTRAWCAVLRSSPSDAGFWATLARPTSRQASSRSSRASASSVDDDYLDDIAAAFGQVIDAKSPYTSGHCERVARVSPTRSRSELGLPDERRRWLRRAALLHDIGKLGVSNAMLDKPGKLDDAGMGRCAAHAALTEAILSRIGAFAELAAGRRRAPRAASTAPAIRAGCRGDEITLETRIITTADIFDALTSKRPWRQAMTVEKALETMRGELGTKVDYKVFEALELSMRQVAA